MVKVFLPYGFVVRRAALSARGVDIARVLEAFEKDAPDQVDEDLLSFGPSFGSEASDEMLRRLERLGLVYVDDFFIFETDYPDWCTLEVVTPSPE